MIFLAPIGSLQVVHQASSIGPLMQESVFVMILQSKPPHGPLAGRGTTALGCVSDVNVFLTILHNFSLRFPANYGIQRLG